MFFRHVVVDEKGKNDLERFFVKMEKDENDIREWMQMTRLISKM